MSHSADSSESTDQNTGYINQKKFSNPTKAVLQEMFAVVKTPKGTALTGVNHNSKTYLQGKFKIIIENGEERLVGKRGKQSNKPVLAYEDVQNVLYELHDKSGHPGMRATYNRVLEQWYSIKFHFVEQYVGSCNHCLTRRYTVKPPRHWTEPDLRKEVFECRPVDRMEQSSSHIRDDPDRLIDDNSIPLRSFVQSVDTIAPKSGMDDLLDGNRIGLDDVSEISVIKEEPSVSNDDAEDNLNGHGSPGLGVSPVTVSVSHSQPVDNRLRNTLLSQQQQSRKRPRSPPSATHTNGSVRSSTRAIESNSIRDDALQHDSVPKRISPPMMIGHNEQVAELWMQVLQGQMQLQERQHRLMEKQEDLIDKMLRVDWSRTVLHNPATLMAGLRAGTSNSHLFNSSNGAPF